MTSMTATIPKSVLVERSIVQPTLGPGPFRAAIRDHTVSGRCPVTWRADAGR